MIDRSRIDPDEIREIVIGIEGIKSCHKIRSRGQEDSVMIDMHIQVSRDMTVEKSHSLVHVLQSRLMAQLPNVHDVVVHTEPDDSEEQDCQTAPVWDLGRSSGR